MSGIKFYDMVIDTIARLITLDFLIIIELHQCCIRMTDNAFVLCFKIL